MNRRPPDEGQQREIERRIAEQSSWIQKSRTARLWHVAPYVAGLWIIAAVTIAVVAPHSQWLISSRIAICSIAGFPALMISACSLGQVLSPERMIRAAVPWSMGREEDFDKPFPDAPLRAVDYPKKRRSKDS